MWLRKLTLQGFKSYKNKTVIDFQKMPANELFLIQGNTGAGKSSILEGIVFALYGTCTITSVRNEHYFNRALEEEIQKTPNSFKGKTIFLVELEFEWNHKIYQIRKELYMKDFKGKFNIESAIKKKEEVRENGNIAKLPEMIARLEKKQFQKIIVIPQNRFAEFLTLSPQEKEKLLESIFQTEDHRNFMEFLKEKKKTKEIEMEKLNSFVNEILNQYSIEKNIEDIKIMEVFQKKQKEIEDKIKNIDENIKKWEEKLTIQQKTKHSIELLKEKLENLRKIRKEIRLYLQNQDRIEKQKEILNNAKRVQELYPLLQIKKEKLIKQKEQEKELQKAKQFLHFEKEKSHILDQKEKELQKQEEEMEQSKIILKEKENILPKIPIYRKILNEIRILKQKKQKKEEEKYQYKNKLEAIEKHLEEIYKTILSEQLKEGEPCPICGSIEHPDPYHSKEIGNPEQFLHNKEEYQKKIELYEKEIQKLDKEIQTKEKESIGIVNFLEERNYHSTSNDWGGIEKQLGKEIQQLKEKIKKFKQNKANIEGEKRKNAQEIGKWEGRITTLKKEIENGNIILQEKDKELQKKMNSENIHNEEEIEKFYKEKKEIELLEKKILEFERQKQELKTKKQQIEEEIKRIHNHILSRIKVGEELTEEELQKEIQSLVNYLNNLEEEITKLKAKLSHLNEEKGSYKQSLENIKKDIKQIEKKQKEYEEIRKEYKKLSALYQICSDENIRKLSFHRFLIQVYFQEMVRLANDCLKNINDRYQLYVDTKKASSKQKKAGLNILIFDHHQGFRSVESLSGGETFYVSLALALGMYDMIHSQIGNLRFDFLFIDEGFGSLDQEILSKVLSTLKRYFIQSKSNQKQLGLISHVESMKDQIPFHIIVHNQNGISSISYQV